MSPSKKNTSTLPKPDKAAAKRKSAKPRPIQVSVQEFRKLGPQMEIIAAKFAKCGHEIPVIQGLLFQIYCTGFTSGAIASRKRFTDWTPTDDNAAFVPEVSLYQFVQDFQMTLDAVHRDPQDIQVWN